MAEARSMHNDKESPFTLTLLDGDLSLQVLQFSGREALNQPYRFDIEVIGLAPAMSLDRLLQQPVFLSLMEGQGIHGVLHSASREHRGPHRIGYKLVLLPYLQWLDRQRSRRVFHHLSVPMILRQLLEEHEVPEGSYRFELSNGHYPLRPFCIQYEESDLTLLQRLCEEEGIHYHFEHQRDGHVLVLADDSLSFPQEPVLTPFQGNAPDDSDVPVINELFQRLVALSLTTGGQEPWLAKTRQRSGQPRFQQIIAGDGPPCARAHPSRSVEPTTTGTTALPAPADPRSKQPERTAQRTDCASVRTSTVEFQRSMAAHRNPTSGATTFNSCHRQTCHCPPLPQSVHRHSLVNGLQAGAQTDPAEHPGLSVRPSTGAGRAAGCAG